jgi:hypothetical protein
VAISRTAAMFFGDHVAAFDNIGHALRSGGRLVLVTWQPCPATSGSARSPAPWPRDETSRPRRPMRARSPSPTPTASTPF